MRAISYGYFVTLCLHTLAISTFGWKFPAGISLLWYEAAIAVPAMFSFK